MEVAWRSVARCPVQYGLSCTYRSHPTPHLKGRQAIAFLHFCCNVLNPTCAMRFCRGCSTPRALGLKRWHKSRHTSLGLLSVYSLTILLDQAGGPGGLGTGCPIALISPAAAACAGPPRTCSRWKPGLSTHRVGRVRSAFYSPKYTVLIYVY